MTFTARLIVLLLDIAKIGLKRSLNNPDLIIAQPLAEIPWVGRRR